MIDSIGNGMIKIVTGVRRSGKSYLLFRLFTEWLDSQGVDEAHIVKVNTVSKWLEYLCNARLNFRQNENTHLMENLIYNELTYRGYNVDVGVVTTELKDAEGKRHKVQLEIDFVCNQGSKRIYIQSAYRMPTEEKALQERMSLTKVDDSFKKVIIVSEDQLVHRNDKGIVTMSLRDFLLDAESLEELQMKGHSSLQIFEIIVWRYGFK